MPCRSASDVYQPCRLVFALMICLRNREHVKFPRRPSVACLLELIRLQIVDGGMPSCSVIKSFSVAKNPILCSPTSSKRAEMHQLPFQRAEKGFLYRIVLTIARRIHSLHAANPLGPKNEAVCCGMAIHDLSGRSIRLRLPTCQGIAEGGNDQGSFLRLTALQPTIRPENPSGDIARYSQLSPVCW